VTRPIAALDVPAARLEQQIRDLVAQQAEQRADASTDRLPLLAPTTPDTTPEEAS
jgi:hypothetical protein